MSRQLRLLTVAARRRALLRGVLGWLLVFVPGLVVLAVATEVFRLTAP